MAFPTTVALLLTATSGCSRPSGNASEVSSTHADSASAVVASPAESDAKTAAPAPGSAARASAAEKKWDFEGDTVNAKPSGFSFGRTGRGREGRWIVQKDREATVLAQVDADDTNFRFPVAVADGSSQANVRVSVRCKMVSGEVDRACGLVARYTDADNYFVTRANALENNVRLYIVRGGRRSEIASYSGTVTANAWHDYRFELRADHLQVFLDGKRVIDHHDSTFTRAGRAGVWTKADSITYFDDFAVEPL